MDVSCLLLESDTPHFFLLGCSRARWAWWVMLPTGSPRCWMYLGWRLWGWLLPILRGGTLDAGHWRVLRSLPLPSKLLGVELGLARPSSCSQVMGVPWRPMAECHGCGLGHFGQRPSGLAGTFPIPLLATRVPSLSNRMGRNVVYRRRAPVNRQG
jgi:hypothetical protein